MAIYISYTPSTAIAKAMFNFDGMGVAELSNYKYSGTIKVSVSDGFTVDDFKRLKFNPDLGEPG